MLSTGVFCCLQLKRGFFSRSAGGAIGKLQEKKPLNLHSIQRDTACSFLPGGGSSEVIFWFQVDLPGLGSEVFPHSTRFLTVSFSV